MAVTPTLTIVEPRSASANSFVSRQTLFNALAIRDSTAHDPTTDASVLLADCTELGGTKLVYVTHNLGVNVTVQLMVSHDGTTMDLIGAAVTVATGTPKWIDIATTSLAIAQLAYPYPYVGFQIVAASAPTAGSVTLLLCVKSS